jgi:hypothetical protein
MLFGSDCNNNMLQDVTGVKRGDTVGLRLLKNKSFKEEKMTQVGLYAIGISTPLEANKSLTDFPTSLTGEHETKGWTSINRAWPSA